MTKKKHDPKSEAALQYVVDKWDSVVVDSNLENPVVEFGAWTKPGYRLVATLDLRDVIKKRQPLTGVKKQLDKIVRGTKKRKVKK